MAETTSVKIVRLETQMNSVEDKVDKLDIKMDSLIGKIDAANAISSEMLILKSNMIGLEGKIAAVDRRRWVQNILSGLLGAVLSILVAYFFNTIGR